MAYFAQHFFRDYVYIPLGGNRRGTVRRILNLLIVWSLTGLWHGASWNFIFWGVYYFVFLVVEKYLLLGKLQELPHYVSHIYTLVVVFFGWILFKFENLSELGIALKCMFGPNRNGFYNMSVGVTFKKYIFFLIFAVIASTPFLKGIYLKIAYLFRAGNRTPYLLYAYEVVVPGGLLILSALALVGNSYNPFLYFRF